MKLAEPFKFPCGAVAKNRVVKAAMTECLADPNSNLPNTLHNTLYARWARGGSGMVITGNVQVDRRWMEAPRNVVLDETQDLEPFKAWAKAASNEGCLAVMQLSHAGRQCPISVTSKPVAPSAVELKMHAMPPLMSRMLTAAPRELTLGEVHEVKQRFITAARRAAEAGFGGVQIHAAHGYLLSTFLSPDVNLRTDAYGGTAEKRRLLLLEILEGIREAVRQVGRESFVVGVKLNSADFQRGGFTEEESLDVVRLLNIDFIEISGGTYENPAMLSEKKKSTKEREAFFLDFAVKARAVSSCPLMLTGGFYTIDGMNSALQSAVDFVGLARPLAVDPDIPRKLISGEITEAKRYEPRTSISALDKMVSAPINNMWHQRAMHVLARGGVPYTSGGVWYPLLVMMPAAYYWDPIKNWRRNSIAALCVLLAVASAYGALGQ